MLIEGFDSGQFASEGETNVSYDLRVGGEYRDHREMGKTELPASGVISLLPGGAVIIETEELICLPKAMFGHVVPKVSLLQQGISNTSSKVDPGYRGRLLITVFNLGKKSVQLRRGDRFCALYVLDVRAGAQPYGKEEKRIVGVGRARIWQTIRDLLEANAGAVMAVLVLATIASIIFQIILQIIARI